MPIAALLMTQWMAPQASPTTMTVYTPEHYQANTPFSAMVVIELERGWHVYWQNAGDTGAPTSIKWNLPEGWTVSEPTWPTPHKFEEPGMVSFGFENRLVLAYQITPGAGSGSVTLQAKGEWLQCKEMCTPGDGEASVTMKEGAGEPSWPNFLKPETLKEQFPMGPVKTTATWGASGPVVKVPAHERLREAVKFEVYPEQESTLDHGKTVKTMQKSTDSWTLTLLASSYLVEKPAELRLVLVPLNREGKRLNAGIRLMATVE